MKHLLTAAASAAAMLAILVTTASGHSSGTTISLVLKDTDFHFVDIAPKGGDRKPPSLGDQFVIGSTALQGGKPVGRSSLICTVTKAGARGMSECLGTLVLPTGTISANGVSRTATNGDSFAVTGGTGAYAGARGTITTSQGKNGTEHFVAKLL